MKVYTRGGDRGETSLFGGERVRKDAVRVDAYGEVDELNAVLGVACARLDDVELGTRLRTIQSSLFDVGAELATPNLEERRARGTAPPQVTDAQIEELESWIDAMDAEIEPLRHFVLPGGAPPAPHLHHARTVCRRAERRVVALAEAEAVDLAVIRYLNRLSDLLFVMARLVNHRSGVAEPRWIGRER